MHETLTKRVAELKDLYANDGYLTFRGEADVLKVLSRVDADNPDYSNQGGLQWIVTRYAKDNSEIGQYGPMDTRELKLLHGDIFWGGEVHYGDGDEERRTNAENIRRIAVGLEGVSTYILSCIDEFGDFDENDFMYFKACVDLESERLTRLWNHYMEVTDE